MAVAKRLCPHAIVVRGNHLRHIAKPEPHRPHLFADPPHRGRRHRSNDEEFFDGRGSIRLLGDPVSIASFTETTPGKDELQLIASVGVGVK